jgi:hypothetical protein
MKRHTQNKATQVILRFRNEKQLSTVQEYFSAIILGAYLDLIRMLLETLQKPIGGRG